LEDEMSENSKPRNVSELFPCRFLVNADLKGRAYTLKIRDVQVEKMRSHFTQREEWKAVVYFERAEKGLVLNKGQAQAMAEICGGEDFDIWTGKTVMPW
jgi:hypothetical protein